MANSAIIVPHILAHEGGLSRAKTDSASAHPAPFTTTAKDSSAGYKLVTASDWHTNKGITWQTFSGNAAKLGYKASQPTWELMPAWVWQKIYKLLYWDAIKGDQLKSQAIANILAEWTWASGNWGVKNLQQVLNREPFNAGLVVDGSMGPKTLEATNKADQTKLYALLTAEYADFINKISTGSNAPNKIGWMNRFNDLLEFTKPYVVPIASGALFFCLQLLG